MTEQGNQGGNSGQQWPPYNPPPQAPWPAPPEPESD
ncbi:MAG: hypothetical protein JWP39_554, partial [Jatrophihabitans sp.]|nr:hypothetical protein [Jatrophihabitans sp.]